MRLGVLFSGGKDSTLALHYASGKEEVACLITLISENKESYMFHTPNIDVTSTASRSFRLAPNNKSNSRQKRRRTFGFGRCNCSSSRKIPDRRRGNRRN